MKKIKLYCIVFIILIIGILRCSDNKESIENYNVVITVRKDGTLNVVEEIYYKFDSSQKHGIYRDIPLKKKREKYSENISIKMNRVLLNGEEEEYQEEKRGRIKRYIIGKKDKYLEKGIQKYTLDYDVGNVFTRNQVYFNAIGQDWKVPIKNAQVEIKLSEDKNILNTVSNLEVYAGKYNERNKDFKIIKNEKIITIKMEEILDSYEGLTFLLNFNKNFTISESIVNFFEDDSIFLNEKQFFSEKEVLNDTNFYVDKIETFNIGNKFFNNEKDILITQIFIIFSLFCYCVCTYYFLKAEKKYEKEKMSNMYISYFVGKKDILEIIKIGIISLILNENMIFDGLKFKKNDNKNEKLEVEEEILLEMLTNNRIKMFDNEKEIFIFSKKILLKIEQKYEKILNNEGFDCLKIFYIISLILAIIFLIILNPKNLFLILFSLVFIHGLIDMYCHTKREKIFGYKKLNFKSQIMFFVISIILMYFVKNKIITLIFLTFYIFMLFYYKKKMKKYLNIYSKQLKKIKRLKEKFSNYDQYNLDSFSKINKNFPYIIIFNNFELQDNVLREYSYLSEEDNLKKEFLMNCFREFEYSYEISKNIYIEETKKEEEEWKKRQKEESTHGRYRGGGGGFSGGGSGGGGGGSW